MKTGPFEIQTLKSPDFEYFRILNGRISDPTVVFKQKKYHFYDRHLFWMQNSSLCSCWLWSGDGGPKVTVPVKAPIVTLPVEELIIEVSGVFGPLKSSHIKGRTCT